MKKKYLILSFLFFSMWGYSQCYTSFTGGEGHFVSKKTDGTLWGWGWGNWGQLATTNDYEFTPVQIGTVNDWQILRSGKKNTFAIKNNGTLWGCGSNSQGALGIGTTAINSYALVQIGSATNWSKIAPSSVFTIALKSNGTLWAWGQNDSYEMGNGTCCSNQLTPIQIGTDTDWVNIDVAKSVDTGFAIKSNGTLWGWGSNGEYLLGGDSSIPTRPVPFQINTDTDWLSISPGSSHMLALKNNGTLWTWGAGNYGQLGYNQNVNNTPTQVGVDTWKSVTGGLFTSFGVKTNGTLWAWGRNQNGQLGLGDATDRNTPTQVGTAINWETVAAGDNTTIATKTDGSVWVWGTNNFGEAGTGDTNPVLTPTQLTGVCVTLTNESFTIAPAFSLRPNPAHNEVTLSFEHPVQDTAVAIYDITGKKIKEYQINSVTNIYPISIQDLSSGIYMVVIRDAENKSSSQKLIVE